MSTDDLFGPLDSAIHATVHEYVNPLTRQRGAVALAPRVGMPAGTLSNKANPTMPDHKLGLVESVVVMISSDDYRILHALNAAVGHCGYRLPPHSNSSDVEILDAYAAAHEKTGLKARAIRDALKDGNITTSELADVRLKFDDEVRAGLEMISRLEALAG